MSSIGYAESLDGVHVEGRSTPLIRPEMPYEQGLGCEDPRVMYTRFASLADVRKPPPGAIAKAIENYDNDAVLPGDQAELVKSRIRRGPELGAPLPFSCPR